MNYVIMLRTGGVTDLNNIRLLDCTLRDGGLGLEDAKKNEIADVKFDKNDISNIITHLACSSIDIVELGSIEITEKDMTGYAIYQNIESVSKTIPTIHGKNQMFVALFRGPDTDMNEIPEWKPGLCEGIRVIIRYSELQKSLDFCAGLSKKGYKVFVQPMLTMRYTDDEIDLIIKEANKMNAYALYFVDSYGYMTGQDIERFSKKYSEKLNPNIRIGFHAHNNMNLAYANALDFIKANPDRDIIIDCCAEGMGQGAGNLQTELIVPYLNNNYKKDYNYDAILNVCEIVEKFIDDNLWGYSPTRLLPAIHNAAYKFSIVFRNKYKLSYSQINKIFENMPKDMKQRYLPEWAEEMVNKLSDC